MPQREQPRGFWWTAGSWVLLLIGLAAVFARTFAEMWIRWFPAWKRPGLGLYDRIVEGESYYTHGPLVPLVSLIAAMLLVRHTRVPVRPARAAGWTVLAGSLLLHLLACLARVNFVSGFALLGALAGLILLLWGGAALRRLWFPVAFLAFMVPLPEVTIAQLNFRLKMLAADWGVALAGALGVLVERNGNQVFLEGGKNLVIANVCNGLRTLISLLAFGALYAYVCRLRGLWRVGLFAMTVPVAAVSNSLRIVSLIVVADVWDAQTATGWYHDFSGILIFLLAFALMFGLERLVLWARRVIGRPAKVYPLFHDVLRGPQDEEQGARLVRAPCGWRGLGAISALAVAVAGTWWLNRAIPPTWNQQMARSAVPGQLQVDGRTWNSYELRMDENTLTILETRDYLFRRYVREGDSPVDFCVIFSGDNRKGTHPPDLCLQGAGEGIVAAADIAVDAVEGRGAVPCRELVVQGGADRQYFLYTYKCGQEYTSSFWRQQAVILLNGLLDRNASGALIRFSTRIEGNNLAQARYRCAAFLRATVPHLDRSLP